MTKTWHDVHAAFTDLATRKAAYDAEEAYWIRMGDRHPPLLFSNLAAVRAQASAPAAAPVSAPAWSSWATRTDTAPCGCPA